MSDMAIEYQHRPITADEYQRMGELGILAADERVELLDGELIVMPPMGLPHAASVSRLTRLFLMRLGESADVRPQLPVRLSRISEPQPDFALVMLRADFYAAGHPASADTYALIECADSSLRYDRGKKLVAYARAAIREYWIVNLSDESIEIYRDPSDLGYATSLVARVGDGVAFAGFPDVRFDVAELLGCKRP